MPRKKKIGKGTLAPEDSSRSIIIIDAYNAFIRSYAIDPSTTYDGQLNGGIKGFLKQIQKYIKEFNPDEIYVVWDGTGGSRRRRRLNKKYKEGRKPVSPNNRGIELSPEERMKNQLWQVRTLMSALELTPIKQIMLNDTEADDVIAVLVKDEAFKGDIKVIISNDKDFYQLLDFKTAVWRPAKNMFMTTKEVLEEFSIHPNNMTIARSLIGDASDNLPGVSGMGHKTVIKFFPELIAPEKITLNEIFQKSKDMDSKYKVIETLNQVEETIRTNYEIMQLQTPQIDEEQYAAIQESILSTPTSYKRVLFDGYILNNDLDDVNWSKMKNYFEERRNK
jgi:5'-3' exonuclease